MLETNKTLSWLLDSNEAKRSEVRRKDKTRRDKTSKQTDGFACCWCNFAQKLATWRYLDSRNGRAAIANANSSNGLSPFLPFCTRPLKPRKYNAMLRNQQALSSIEIWPRWNSKNAIVNSAKLARLRKQHWSLLLLLLLCYCFECATKIKSNCAIEPYTPQIAQFQFEFKLCCRNHHDYII